MKIILLAGGSGTRLWPVSRKSYPKQFLTLGDSKTLFQKTIQRFLKLFQPEDFLIITNQEYIHIVKDQVEQIHPDLSRQILLEPERKNTAPAIALGLKFLQERGQLEENECILVTASDHLISPEDLFLEKIKLAQPIAKAGFHITFGVWPQKPATGYGYIKFRKSGLDCLDVEHFIEKPSLKKAQEYLESGEYLWNTGIFLFHVKTLLKELTAYAPEIVSQMDGSFQEMYQDFLKMPSISIDYALMEKSNLTKVIPLNLTWSDIGSWDSVFEVSEKDQNQNVKIGNVYDLETKNCLIMGGKRLITTINLENLLVIDTEDALLVAKKGESQKIKAILEALQETHKKEINEHRTMQRPWGSYTILEEGERYKIKRILVRPSQKLSLQLHYHRSEHWIVVRGTAKVTLVDKESLLHENESLFVPKSTMHRLENPGKVPLELIEVQVGEYVGEDDIVRFEDIYGRTEQALAPI